MTKGQRIRGFLIVILELLCIAILLCFPTIGKTLVIAIISVALMVLGIRYLVWYFTMAKNMVGGKTILFRGAILFDLGVLVGSTQTLPSSYVTFFLVGYFLISGLYRCLKMWETRKVKDSKWILIAIVAAWYIILALVGFFNLGSEQIMIYLFCIELFVVAMNHLRRVFKKTAIVYIQ